VLGEDLQRAYAGGNLGHGGTSSLLPAGFRDARLLQRSRLADPTITRAENRCVAIARSLPCSAARAIAVVVANPRCLLTRWRVQRPLVRQKPRRTWSLVRSTCKSRYVSPEAVTNSRPLTPRKPSRSEASARTPVAVARLDRKNGETTSTATVRPFIPSMN
jgi:hypothetical protein